jgi:hypothetical protein
MVRLRMVAHDIGKPTRIHMTADLFEEHAGERRLDRVNKGRTLILDQVCVVARPPFGSIPVEVADFPVHTAYPVNSFSKSCSHKWSLRSNCARY